jgi:hypothetical protein
MADRLNYLDPIESPLDVFGWLAGNNTNGSQVRLSRRRKIAN